MKFNSTPKILVKCFYPSVDCVTRNVNNFLSFHVVSTFSRSMLTWKQALRNAKPRWSGLKNTYWKVNLWFFAFLTLSQPKILKLSSNSCLRFFVNRLVINWHNFALSLRAGFDSHSNPGSWNALRRCSMVRKANCETPPTGGRGHSFYVLPSDLVELRSQVQLLETFSWQIFHVHNNDLWFHDCR